MLFFYLLCSCGIDYQGREKLKEVNESQLINCTAVVVVAAVVVVVLLFPHYIDKLSVSASKYIRSNGVARSQYIQLQRPKSSNKELQ